MHDEFPDYHSYMDGNRARMRRNRAIGLSLLAIAAAGAMLLYRLNF